MQAKKVDAEVIEREYIQGSFSKKPLPIFTRIKFGIAVTLDLIDLLIGWIPILNTLWDFVTFLILLVILRNKKLAAFSLLELPFFGLPPFSFFDMLIPTATILVMIDNGMKNIMAKKL
jgi:hypothetical protein|tara:strand:- start:612 stop:965 length:354 start_codon:yes stop_codon:yes gene_type:complete